MNAAASQDINKPNRTASMQKTQVIIIGTIHGRHLQNFDYKPEVLKDIILSLKPAAILNELPISQWDPNGRPLHKDHDKHPEGWASDTAAHQLNAKQFPYDRPNRNEHYRKTDYWKRSKTAQELAERWAQQQHEKDSNCVDLKILQLLIDASWAQGAIDIHGGPKQINCESYDCLIRVKHSLNKEILPRIIGGYPDFEQAAKYGEFYRSEWRERNEIMANNIVKIATDYKGKRIVVLTGSEHRYILKDLLNNKKTIALREYWQIEENEKELQALNEKAKVE
ncbi:MAG: hypothetical protein KAI59_01350 [Planctomycetes bacterium]|nr:hypothetical protein [Planctomycetota bacterium]